MSQFRRTGNDNTFALMRGGWLGKHSQFPFIGIIEEISLRVSHGNNLVFHLFLREWPDKQMEILDKWGRWEPHTASIFKGIVLFSSNTLPWIPRVCAYFHPLSFLFLLCVWGGGRKGAASGRPLKDTSTWPLLTVLSLRFWMRTFHPLQTSPPICPSFLHLDCERNF